METATQFLETLATASKDQRILDIKKVLGADAKNPISGDLLDTLSFLYDAIRRAIREHLSGKIIAQDPRDLELTQETYEKTMHALRERLTPHILKIEYIVAIHHESETAKQVALSVVTALMQQNVQTPIVSIEASTNPNESLLKIVVYSTAQNLVTESELFAIVQTVCREQNVKAGATFFN